MEATHRPLCAVVPLPWRLAAVGLLWVAAYRSLPDLSSFATHSTLGIPMYSNAAGIIPVVTGYLFNIVM